MEWTTVEQKLGQLLEEYGPPSPSSAAYPFTRLRSDGVWQLTREVPFDNLGPLQEAPISGHFTSELEQYLKDSPTELARVARQLVVSQFPDTMTSDVLNAVGLDPDVIFAAEGSPVAELKRRRSSKWRDQILLAWQGTCAVCGYDGRLGQLPVGIDAAHIRWFNHGGPEELDNGLALCSLHHRLLDGGVLGFSDPRTIIVSSLYAAQSDSGKRVYDLHGAKLAPGVGAELPAQEHVDWHTSEVFKATPLSA